MDDFPFISGKHLKRNGLVHGVPATLDPYVITGSPSARVIKSLFEGLLIPHPESGKASPGVASHWDISEDQTVYTFYLRPEAKWSDGKALTAHDFVASHQRVLAPALAAEGAIDFYYIVGAQAYNEGKENDFSTVGINALDDHTLRISLNHPIPHLFELMLTTAWLPVRVDLIEKFGRIDQRGTAWPLPGNLVGNGAFVLKEWRQNEMIIVEKSPTYWDAENVGLERIIFHLIENVDTVERAFRSGRLHVTDMMAISKLDAYRSNEPDLLINEPESRNQYLLVKPGVKHLDDKRVRQALSLAIDREQIAKQVMKSSWILAYNLIPQGMDSYPSQKQIERNLSKARELMAEAGYQNGEGFPEIEIVHHSRGDPARFLQAIQEQWKKELGVRATLRMVEWKVWLTVLKEGTYQISIDGFGKNHPHRFFELFKTGNLESYYFWSNEEYDRLLAKAGRLHNREERIPIYDRMEKILADEVPMIPLSFEVKTHLKHPSVKGWNGNLYDARPWKAIYLEAVE